MSVILYERQKGNVKVVAAQTRVEGEEAKFTYAVSGFVNGELVKEISPEGGFRMQAPAARAMFKELVAEFAPTIKVEKEAKPARVYTAEDRDAEIAKLERRIERLREVTIVEAYPEAAPVAPAVNESADPVEAPAE